MEGNVNPAPSSRTHPRSLARGVLHALVASAAIGCSSPTEAPPDRIRAVTFALRHLTTVPGAFIRVPVAVRDTSGRYVSDAPVWSSSAPGVATVVDSFGAIRVSSAGSALIVARVGTRADTLHLDAAAVTFVDVSIGSGFTCGLTSTDDVFCWGALSFYDPVSGMGPSQIDARAPAKTAHVAGAQRLTVGFHHMCALAGANAQCWGSNEYGQLGQGGIDSLYHPTPVAVPGVSPTSLGAGGLFTCGLETGGSARCWGFNRFGELGDSSYNTSRPAPVQVRGGIAFGALSSGQFHTCGLDLRGAAFCWGNGAGGITGPAAGTAACVQTSTGPNCTVPIPVDTSLRFTAIDASGERTCALTAAGAVWCWGVGFSAQPVQVSGSIVFTSAATGATHVCGLSATGAAWCWGDNSAGQMGNGLVEFGTSYPTPVAVTGGFVFAALRAGGSVTCGITPSGRVFCWGSDSYGELGDGSDFSVRARPEPTEVAGQP
jgi:alpha-tubulin suppressor-like RCC1 family protein